MEKCKLSTSYRLTNSIGRFVNEYLVGENIIHTNKEGPEIIYLKDNIYMIVKKLTLIIQIEIENGLKPEDIFILAPSTKNKDLKLIENELVINGIPCYGTDNNNLNDVDLIKRKVVFSTIHQSKGRERKLVVVYGFDASYYQFYDKDKDPTICTSNLYVAVTRASERLILVHNNNYPALPCLKKAINDCDDIIMFNDEDKVVNIPKFNRTTSAKISTNIIELTKYLRLNNIEKVNELIDIFTVEREDDLFYEICNKIKTKGVYEDVEKYTIILLKTLFELLVTENKTKIEKNMEDIKILVDDDIVQLINEINIPEGCVITNELIEEYLKLIIIYMCTNEGYISPLKQIDKYDWIDRKDVKKILKDMINIIGYKNIKFDKMLKDDNNRSYVYETKDKKITLNGKIDILTKDTVWLIKYADALTLEHKLEICIYAYVHKIIGTKYKYYQIYNIKTGEILKLQLNYHHINKIFDILIANRYECKSLQTDEEFIYHNTCY